MARKKLRFGIDELGHLEIIDPGFDSMDIIKEINPTFKIKTSPLPYFDENKDLPRFCRSAKIITDINIKDLADLNEESLWSTHDRYRSQMANQHANSQANKDCVSLLSLKVELARRMLISCNLCGHQCGVNRFAGEKGICGLDQYAYVYEHFTHIAEEPPINPSYLVSLMGCALRCCFCQQWETLDPNSNKQKCLCGDFWEEIDLGDARTISFIGGNPDESTFAILKSLKDLNPGINQLPIVWNANGYATKRTLGLLDGVVDAYVVDFKFGNDACAEKLSGAKNYTIRAIENIQEMVRQNVLVIVRILVLPGHVECCHLPSLAMLSRYASHSNLFLSIRDQYRPDGMISDTDGCLKRRPEPKEIETVLGTAEKLNLPMFN